MFAWCPHYHKDLLLSIASLTVPTGEFSCPGLGRMDRACLALEREKLLEPGVMDGGGFSCRQRELVQKQLDSEEVLRDKELFHGWEDVSAPLLAPRAVLSRGKRQWAAQAFNPRSALPAPGLVCQQDAPWELPGSQRAFFSPTALEQTQRHAQRTDWLCSCRRVRRFLGLQKSPDEPGTSAPDSPTKERSM